MSVAWIRYGIEKGPSDCCFPTKGAPDGPTPPYPTSRQHRRGRDRPVLPGRRRLRPAQPARAVLRVPQEALRFGGPRPRLVPAASGSGVRALVLARRREVLLSPLPRGSEASPLLLQPAREEAAALPGASTAGRGGRGASRRTRDAVVVDSTLLSVLDEPGAHVCPCATSSPPPTTSPRSS